VRDTTNIAQFSLDGDNFVQCLVLDGTVDPNSVVQCQANVEREPLKIAIWIDILGVFQVLEQLMDTGSGLEIDKREITSDGLPIQSGRRGFSCSLD